MLKMYAGHPKVYLGRENNAHVTEIHIDCPQVCSAQWGALDVEHIIP